MFLAIVSLMFFLAGAGLRSRGHVQDWDLQGEKLDRHEVSRAEQARGAPRTCWSASSPVPRRPRLRASLPAGAHFQGGRRGVL